MTHRERLLIGPAGAHIALTRWGNLDPRKPAVLLVHGTGFVADIWEPIAADLAGRYTVYALDRRGHGASHQPAPPGGYHFADFAEDLCAVIQSLGLSNVFGIGHSAGATDLLLAARLLPGRFARLFVMEPTVMDPRGRSPDGGGLSDEGWAAVRGAGRRRAEFDSASTLFERLRVAPAFADWTPAALWTYVDHGFERLADGRVRLRCAPEIESAILLPIFEAMEQVYDGDHRGNPFEWLSDVDCPVRIACAERSGPIYAQMVARAHALMPAASRWTFDGVGHCVAQEAPERLLRAIQAFETDGGSPCQQTATPP